MPTVIKGQPTSEEVLRRLKEEGRPVVLSFSCGKDSLAAWVAMERHGIEVVPVYLWLVPHLSFVEESLAYYERAFGARIRRYPHPSFYRWLNNAVYQAPERLRVIEAARLPTPDYDEEFALIFDDVGLPRDTWRADGVRAADSLQRRAALTRHGVMRWTVRKVSPIADWLKGEVMDAIRGRGLRLPVDYEMFGRSFDGIDRRFMEPMRERYPEDWERVREWFPLLVADSIRKGADPDGL